jgi:hypothetical protein
MTGFFSMCEKSYEQHGDTDLSGNWFLSIWIRVVKSWLCNIICITIHDNDDDNDHNDHNDDKTMIMMMTLMTMMKC